MNELAETTIEISGKDIEIEPQLPKATGTGEYGDDETRIRVALDSVPEVTLEDV